MRVLAHGTFDIIHYGHVNYLEKAKSFGDYFLSSKFWEGHQYISGQWWAQLRPRSFSV